MTDNNAQVNPQDQLNAMAGQDSIKQGGDPFKQAKLLKAKDQKRVCHYFLLAFFIPFIILSLAYSLQSIYPVGDRQILTVDLYHQYAPFLRELRSKILTGDSLFYSWTGGLGFNFYGVITYYLLSPFNLILLLFKESQLSEAVLLITLLKIASAGLSFYYYAYKSQSKHDYFYVGLASAYALSGYSLTYSWNIMWLDAIILLPIIVWGLHKLIRQKSPWLYLISLCLLIITNYYMAFFVCLFLAFYFFVLLAQYGDLFKGQRGARRALRCFLTFAGSSLLAALLSAVTLWPTYLALLKTSASGDRLPESIKFFDPFIDFVSRLLALASPSIRDGMANIYVGVFVLLFLPAFFLSKKISVRSKFAHALMLVFMLFSLNNNVLNFIWHGFHYPNQLPYRNSFVLVFLLATMVLEVYRQGRLAFKINWHKLVFIWLVIFLFLQKIDSENYRYDLILTSLILLFIYGMIMQTWQDSKISSKSIAFLLLFVVTVELLMSTVITINSIGDNEYYGLRDGYKAGEYVASIEERVEQISLDSPNARAALWPDKSVNDPMLYGYPGLTIFASTYPEDPVQFFANLGYDSNDINSYQNTGSNIILDSLFGLKYKITGENRQEQVSFYRLLESDDQTALYQNDFSLPLLYFVPHQARNLGLHSGAASFENQDSLIKILGGEEGMLKRQAFNIGQGIGNEILSLSDNEFSISKEDGVSGQRSMSYNLNIQKSGYYTVAWQADGLSFDQVNMERLEGDRDFSNSGEGEMSEVSLINDEAGENTHYGQTNQLSHKKKSLADIGYCQAGQIIRLKFQITEDSSDHASIKLEAAMVDQVKLASFTDKLRAYSVDPNYLSANHLNAEIEAPENGYILFTTTYDDGWQIKVNGEKVEFLPLDKALILIPVSKGLNKLDLEYMPEGFAFGLRVSLLTSLLLILYLVGRAWFVKRRKAADAKLHTDQMIRPLDLPAQEKQIDLS